MAQWVSASLSDLLPSEIETVFTAIKALTSTVSTPLQAVSSLLSVAKNLLVSLPLFDFLGAVEASVESIRANFLGAGYYLLDMWDYPAKQLEPVSYGPNNTIKEVRLKGDLFKNSFQNDLLDSFDDLHDMSRPQFTGNCAALILVVARGTLDDLNIMPEEDHIGYAWRGLKDAVHNAGKKVRDIRTRAMIAKIRLAAESQPSDKVAIRVERVQRVFNLYTHMTQEEKDLIPIPMDSETGESFFEGKEGEEIDWVEDVEPILETVEAYFEPYEYPDWQRITLNEAFPDLVVIFDTIFDSILDLLESGATIKEAIVNLIAAIQAKLDELQRIIDLIDTIIEQLDIILEATGFHALFLTTTQGIDDLKDQIEKATSFPFSGKGYYAGMTLLVGGDTADVSAFQSLFGPIAGS